MKPQSRAARIRAVLTAHNALTAETGLLPRQIIRDVQKAERDAGIPESTEMQVYWAIGIMFRGGVLDRTADHHFDRRYWVVREPVMHMQTLAEKRRLRSERLKERRLRNGGKSREQIHAEAQERKAVRKAETARRQAERDAAVRAKRQAELDARAKRAEEKAKQQAQNAALDRARALLQQMKARQAQERQPKAPVPYRDVPRPLQHVMPPKPPKLETSFEAEARGVPVERLPPGAWSKPLKHFPVANAA